MIKIWFFWTPVLAKSVLKDLYESKLFEVVFVVTSIDKPFWRKQILKASPVKEFSLEKNIKLFQEEKLKDNQNLFNKLKIYNADYFIVVAYGKILPIQILEIPKKMCINIHWSILPKYRWASPIQQALINWDTETWITIMQMTQKMDEWDIIDILKIPIKKFDNYDSLIKIFSNLSWKFLIDTLSKLELNKLNLISQIHENASHCSKINKNDWLLDFNKDVKNLFNLWKWFTSWPWIYTFFKNKKLIIEKCDFIENTDIKLKIWEIVKLKNDIWIKCNKWILILNQVKLEWSKSQNIKDFINWHWDFIGTLL